MKVGSAWNWRVETKELFIAVRAASENVVLPSRSLPDISTRRFSLSRYLDVSARDAHRRSSTEQSIINQGRNRILTTWVGAQRKWFAPD